MLTVRATVQEIPPDHHGAYDLGRGEVSADAADYPSALAAVEEQVGHGWRIIALRVDRDPAIV